MSSTNHQSQNSQRDQKTSSASSSYPNQKGAFPKNTLNNLGSVKIGNHGQQYLETNSTVESSEQACGLNSPKSTLSNRKKKEENQGLLFINMFNHISGNNTTISCIKMRNYLQERGFLPDDPRWKGIFDELNKVENITILNFEKIFSKNITDLQKCVDNNFIIEDFDSFRNTVNEIFLAQVENRSGQNAQYIPQLARQDSEKYGLSFCSIDGQRFSLGDSEDEFCIQSCSKPINYGIALEGVGLDTFHKFVGREPSGRAFNSVALTDEGIPYNPMVNSGAIMTCSLVEKDLNISMKFEKVLWWWKRLAGGLKPGFDNATYLSEFETADNNFHLAYYMKSEGLFPEGTNLKLNLQFYFQCCSIEMNCKKLAIVAATLANGGICPLTREKVFSGKTTKHILSLMYSCGMYDYSGQFAFKVGLPGKSGVSGCIMVVIPGVGGFCTWSPRLDKYGNSARGIGFFEDLVKIFTFHNFDILSKLTGEDIVEPDEDTKKSYVLKKSSTKDIKGVHYGGDKVDPLRKRVSDSEIISELLFAAMEDDTNTIRNIIMKGFNINLADYDNRTALHIAASEGHIDSVEILLKAGADSNIRDRFNNTPLDDAIRGKHTQVAELIKKH